jgi:hypothetical protein
MFIKIYFRMKDIAFTSLVLPLSVKMQVAVAATDTLLLLSPSTWKIYNNNKLKITQYQQNHLTEEQLAQLLKVYSTCIHPSQYLPQLFQEDSASSILAAGVYVAEVCKQIETYSTLGNGFVAQHCRHIGIESIYLFLTLLIIILIIIIIFTVSISEIELEKLKQNHPNWKVNSKWVLLQEGKEADKINVRKALAANMESFYSTYPLVKREGEQVITQEGKIATVTSNIISTKSVEITKPTSTNHKHLESYLAYLRSGARLYDGVENISINCIVAIQPDRKNGIPWFGKVMKILEEKVQILWLHKDTNTRYFYLDDKLEMVHKETIICNGVALEPIYGQTLLWKLLTPLSFIKEMAKSDKISLERPFATSMVEPKQKKIDFTSLVFADRDDFIHFVYNYEKFY